MPFAIKVDHPLWTIPQVYDPPTLTEVNLNPPLNLAEPGDERLQHGGKLAWLLDRDFMVAVQERQTRTRHGSNPPAQHIWREDRVVNAPDNEGWHTHRADLIGERVLHKDSERLVQSNRHCFSGVRPEPVEDGWLDGFG